MSTNLFSAFKALLPADPLLLGTVLSSVDGVSEVELLGGEVITVRGTAEVAVKVWVRGSLIEGQAPSLPFVAIDV